MHHFVEVLLNAYKNGDVSALLLELCNRSMFDLLKESYLIPKRFHGKAVQQAEAMGQADAGVTRIADIIQTNSATAEETSATSEELSAQASTMDGIAAKFVLTED